MATTTVQSSNSSAKAENEKKASVVKRSIQKRRKGVKALRKSSAPKVTEAMTAQVYRQGRDAVTGAYHTAAKVGAEASRALPKLSKTIDLRSRGQSVYAMMEEQPLIAGAVGLGVGIVLAALLPHGRQDTESRRR